MTRFNKKKHRKFFNKKKTSWDSYKYLKFNYEFDSPVVVSLASLNRVTNFSTAGSSGLFVIKYLAKKSDLVTCFSTFLFQALFLIFFFDFEVRFC